ncbi:hypothetical protein NJBCHELONAE_01940 [Mycobacteroides chelonae]|uniref:hypothetical protein n=1 Tax=Mycobacteroides chelonae TaxID=1774 RepID=UPI0021DE61C2|nr:hypothetical protein [Mycobacteroides chelonae]GLE54883.1 hypothetical protein NJBCHELONAE_01940 [Mycobacteroides chelonae]
MRKPRLWHVLAAAAFALIVLATAFGSALLGFAGFALGVAACVSGWRRAKALAKHTKDVSVVEHFLRTVPEGGEGYVSTDNLRAVLVAGAAAATYLVHERLYLGAADGQMVFERADRYRDAARRANAQYVLRVPTMEGIAAVEAGDELAPPDTHAPTSDSDEGTSANADWRSALANNESEDWS